MKVSSLSVVLPAYNEAANIKIVVESVFNFLKNNFTNFEIIVVDDGSTDKTHSICKSIKEQQGECLKIIRHQENKGYGAALRSDRKSVV